MWRYYNTTGVKEPEVLLLCKFYSFYWYLWFYFFLNHINHCSEVLFFIFILRYSLVNRFSISLLQFKHFLLRTRFSSSVFIIYSFLFPFICLFCSPFTFTFSCTCYSFFLLNDCLIYWWPVLLIFFGYLCNH